MGRTCFASRPSRAGEAPRLVCDASAARAADRLHHRKLASSPSSTSTCRRRTSRLGWRYPFFVAFTINVVALFAPSAAHRDRGYAELYESRDLTPVSVAEVLNTQGTAVLVGAFVPLASFALFHLVTIFRSRTSTCSPTARRASSSDAARRCGHLPRLHPAVGLDRGPYRPAHPSRHLRRSDRRFQRRDTLPSGRRHDGPDGLHPHRFCASRPVARPVGRAQWRRTSPGRDRYTGSALTTDLAWLIGAGFAPLVALARPAASVWPRSGSISCPARSAR